MQVLVAYLHFIGIMALMGTLVYEHMILKPGLNQSQIKSLAGIDLVYGMAAIIVLATGLLRWLVYEKGYDFYMSNPLFHIKLTLFVIMGVLSIFPTRKFLKWRKQLKQGNMPIIDKAAIGSTLMLIRIQLLILVIIPLLAVLISMGKSF
ncbi:MAG: DUF2214 family protein [Bacteroidales bacterium]|nr:DUF2214 family protein [Bacteroidales bacterium]MCF8404494.1 DUF2214 family protein [Bacteroidales bacterium]